MRALEISGEVHSWLESRKNSLEKEIRSFTEESLHKAVFYQIHASYAYEL